MNTVQVPPEAVSELIGKSFDISPGELSADMPLFSNGRLDSFHLVELISILEKFSGRRIAPGEVNLENLDTPRRIAALLASKPA
jgi:acyl carrier protein